MLASCRVAQLAQCLRFDLADTLAGDIELLADFLEGVVGVHVDTEAHAQDLGYPCGESGEDVAGGFLEALHGRHVDRRLHGGVFDEVAQVRVFVVTDGSFHGDRFFGDLQDLADLVLGHFHALAQLFGRGLAAHFLQHLTGDAVELVDRLDHVHRDADGPRLVGNGASDRLANPPGGVGRELVAATVFELVHRLHQADVAFLDQVEELQAAVGILLGDGNNQAQVGLDHLFLRPASLGFTDGHAAVDVLDVGNGQYAFFFQGDQLLLAALDVFLARGDGFGVFALAGSQLIGPVEVGLVVGELAQEVGTRHAGIAHADLHDGAFLGADLAQGIAYTLDQRIVLLGDELDGHEQGGQFLQSVSRLLAATAMLLQGFLGDVQLLGNGTEAHAGNFRVRAAIAFFLFAVGLVFFLVILVVVGRLRSGLRRDGLDFLRGGSAVVIGVDIAAKDVGQAATFSGDALVIGENAVDRAREMSDGAHDFANAFLDAFGDFDLAFAGQQFDRTHFTHVHAHGVGGAPDIRFHCSESRGGLLAGTFIRRTLVYVYARVTAHPDAIIHLFRIANILRQGIIEGGVSPVNRLTATRYQIIEARLLSRFSGHSTVSTKSLGGLNISRGL